MLASLIWVPKCYFTVTQPCLSKQWWHAANSWWPWAWIWSASQFYHTSPASGGSFALGLETSMGMAVPYTESSSCWVSSLVKGLNHPRGGIPAICPKRLFHQCISLLWHLASWTEQSLFLLEFTSCLYLHSSLDHSQVRFWVLKPCYFLSFSHWLAKLNRCNSFPSKLVHSSLFCISHLM